jgi:phospholipid/cholesterol/gamma-HCH transport system ATP-binding protein
MLKLSSVGVELAGRMIFSGVNFEVREKESVALVGPSGAGKTLLLKTACGLVPRYRGRIFLFGRELGRSSWLEKQEMRRKIGFSFQQAALFDFLDVRSNIAFPLKEALGLGKSEIKSRVNTLLGQLGLEDAAKKMPSQLSGGMKKRVSLGRAIVHNPQLLFCDDPTAGLDPVTSSAITDLILKLRQELKLTMVVVSNQLSVIRKLADRVCLLYSGELMDVGSSQELEFRAGTEWSRMVRE